MAANDFLIVEAIYPGMTQLDFTGPHTVFTRIPGAAVAVASEAGGVVESDGGLVLRRHAADGRDRPLRPVVLPGRHRRRPRSSATRRSWRETSAVWPRARAT